MDWVSQWNEAIDYIEENLNGEISYDVIAKMTGCSVYHFQRMFSYIADKPLAEYIRGRRLSMAAFDLFNGSERIIDIAIKYGYESQDSFSRAFRQFHGILPSKVRQEVVSLRSCPKLVFQITIKGEYDMNYQIERLPGFTVMGVAHPVRTAEAFEVVPKIWEQSWQNGTMQRFLEVYPDYRPAGFLGIAAGGEWGRNEDMDYIIGITSHFAESECKHLPVLEGMQEIAYPEATWVIFEANGDLPAATQNIYKQFYSEWLPNSGYVLADLPVIECYLQEQRQEVWIAVEKK